MEENTCLICFILKSTALKPLQFILEFRVGKGLSSEEWLIWFAFYWIALSRVLRGDSGVQGQKGDFQGGYYLNTGYDDAASSGKKSSIFLS